MSFPGSCVRGVQEKKHLLENGFPATTLFYPDERTGLTRADGGFESSVNWEDDDTVLRFTLNYKAKGQYQFPHGAVRLPCSEIDHLNAHPQTPDALKYERSAVQDNPYHGHIVYRSDLPKPTIRGLAGALALAASQVFTR
jgi:hypothetical protein